MAVLTTFTIGGTNVVPLVNQRSLRIEKRLGFREVCTFMIRDADGDSASYRPAIRDEVLIVLDGVTEFLGLVWRIDEQHVLNARGVELRVDCVDYAALLEVVYFNGPIGGGLLRDVSTPLITNLAPHGIIQDPGTDAGPSVGDQAFPFVTIQGGLNDLSLESGWPWRVTPQIGTNVPVIGFYEPGTLVAPQDFTTAVGRVERASFRRDLSKYVNEIWVRYGEGTAVVTQRLSGNGTIREWRLENDLTLPYPGTVHVTRAGGVSDETFSLWPSGGGTWQYDRANVWNQRIVHASGTVLASGEFADITYTAQFPGAVLARDDDQYLLHGPFTRVEDLPNVFDRATALAYAEALLRRMGGTPRLATIRTAVAGYAPLQTVTINLPNLSVNSAGFLITEVTLTHRTTQASGNHHFGYEVKAIEGNEAQENWLDFYLPERRNRGFGVVPPEGAGGVGGEQPPTTGPGPEFTTFGIVCYPTGAVGVDVATNASAAWTNGSWIEIIPASAAPAVPWAFLGLHVQSLVDTSQGEFDVAIGPAGSETRIATLCWGGNVTNDANFLECPVAYGPIPAGTRLSARVRYDDNGAQEANSNGVKAMYYASVPNGITLTTLALSCYPTAALGVSVTHSGVAWTNGAWVQVIASTPENWTVVGVQTGDGQTDGFLGIEIDVGVGTTPVTTMKWASPQASSGCTQGFILDQPLSGTIPIVPIGSQVQLRQRTSSGSGAHVTKLLYYPGVL